MVSAVTNFYNDKTVLITGGTGFLGVCLIEKLLRSVPGIKSIHLLLRSKKGKQIEERLEELKKNLVFNRIREENKTDLFKKIIPVAGDINEENLGLSSADRLTIIKEVQIVFHSAATLDFQVDLKTAVNINLLGTRRIVQLCQEIRDLKALVHVSTAFVNSILSEVEERVYPSPYDVNELLKVVEKLDNVTLDVETPNILKDHMNSYTFTKHLAEHEIENAYIPAAIVRPSIIVGSWKEPVPGWTISKNGPQGFFMYSSKGVVRRFLLDKNLITDYIPVDIVVNTLITAAYAVDRDSQKKLKVYHCTSSTVNPFRWCCIETELNYYLNTFPLLSAIWYPHVKFISSIFLFKLSTIFIHLLPAYILDTIIKLSGGQPILVQLQRNVTNSFIRLHNFTSSEWKFYNTCAIELHESLSEDDTQLFNLDITSLVWQDYFGHLINGVRLYLCKESPKTLTKAQFKNKILLIAHLILQVALIAFVWWLVKTVFASTWTKTSVIVPITHILFNQL